MNKSESIGKLAQALALAQGELNAAAKARLNPFFHSKYADLASVWDACRAPLSKHGLSVIQLVEPAEKLEGGLYETRAVVETILAHESGEWISSRISLPVLGPELKGGGRGEVNAQSFGSAITYARRYALAAVVGVYQDDEDANDASGNESVPRMPESALADHLAAMETASTLDELAKVYALAVKAAGRDQASMATIIQTKNVRKAQLDPKKAAA